MLELSPDPSHSRREMTPELAVANLGKIKINSSLTLAAPRFIRMLKGSKAGERHPELHKQFLLTFCTDDEVHPNPTRSTSGRSQ